MAHRASSAGGLIAGALAGCALCLCVAGAIAVAAPARRPAHRSRSTHTRACASRARAHGRARRRTRCRAAARKPRRSAAHTPARPGPPQGAAGVSGSASGGSPPAGAGTPSPSAEGGAGTSSGPPSVPHVGVIAVEFHYTLSRTTVPAGRVIFDFTNNGQDEHNLNVQPGEGPVAGSFANLQAHGVSEQAIILRPGSYTLFCSLPEHEAKGMKATLVVE